MDIQKTNTSTNGSSLRRHNNYHIQEKDNTTRNVWLCIIIMLICLVVGSICLTMAKSNGRKDNKSIIEKENNKIDSLKKKIKDLQDEISKEKNRPQPDQSKIAKLNSDIYQSQKEIETLKNELEGKLCVVEKIEYRTNRHGYTKEEKKLEFKLENCSSSVNMQFIFGVGLLIIALFLLIGLCCLFYMICCMAY
jgi:septal ring factor EnvC (AmiA/AmiB activator)